MRQKLYLFDKKSAKVAVSACVVALHVAVIIVVSLQPDLAVLLTLQHHALTHHTVVPHVVGRCIHVLGTLLTDTLCDKLRDLFFFLRSTQSRHEIEDTRYEPKRMFLFGERTELFWDRSSNYGTYLAFCRPSSTQLYSILVHVLF